MKKTLSVVLALVMMLSSFSFSIIANAEATKPTTKEIKAQITVCADLLVKKDTEFTYGNAGDLLLFLNSGKDMSAYKDAFVKSVTDNLKDNKGKIVDVKSDWSQDAEGNWIETKTEIESVSTYAATILCLKAYGIDPSAIEVTEKDSTVTTKYDIVKAMTAIDITKADVNPYNYRLVLEAAKVCKLEDKYVKDTLNTFINNTYKLGKGMDNWGYNCDNTSMFIVTVAPYESYSTFVNDAKELLPQYKVKGGYYSTADYGKDANADSTALALAAYSALGDIATAESIYNDLCTSFAVKDGGFGYTDNKELNAYATKDALLGLECFLNALPACYDGHSFGDNLEKCSVCGEVNPNYVAPAPEPTPAPAITKDDVPVVKGLTVKSNATTSVTISWTQEKKATGYKVYVYNTEKKAYVKVDTLKADAKSYKFEKLTAGTSYKFKVAAVIDDVTGARSTALKAVTKPAKATISKVTSPSKKKINVAIKSQNCTGYEIQWSTTSDFSKNIKSVTCTKKEAGKKVATAQSKKKYYVRVRAYKTLGETKNYGAWSSTKTITTK